MKKILLIIFLVFSIQSILRGQSFGTRFLNEDTIGMRYFGNDKEWYLKNIPFFQCSDTLLQDVYYYRWKLYKAHLRNLGKKGFIVTEFLNAMSWDRKPYNSLNDATAYHIYEGRWLKDPRYMRDYINYMYKDGGNDRHFSEAIADAAYHYFLVNPDTGFIVSQLPFMIKIYNEWYDHYDTAKGLYFIDPLLDATEYTIASIDASGGKDGFFGGTAFRPSINSYMYANAIAIKNIALLENDTAITDLFNGKALEIKNRLQKDLWNDSLQDFVDRYKVNNQYVRYWQFIRGRELVGYEPWAFDLPDDLPKFDKAWEHLMDTTAFMGKYGLRTDEPSYPYYMKQYRYDKATGLRECQWNGPSWPFQTCMVLRGMANLLNNDHQHIISDNDYLFVLRQYARQHYLHGQLDLVEDYDPDKGGTIVNIPQRSEHYNHSEFNDLIITGLCGLRVHAGNKLVVNPLISVNDQDPGRIKYFCLQNVLYHGHDITILYDEDGKKYHQGKGLSVYVDNRRVVGPVSLRREVVNLPPAIVHYPNDSSVDLAVNLLGKGFPVASASYTDSVGSLNVAIDGRIWYFTNVINRWSCYGSGHKTDWFQIAFKRPEKINSIGLFFYGDSKKYAAPLSYVVEYWNGKKWQKMHRVRKIPAQPLDNTGNMVYFDPVHTSKVRIYFTNAGKGKYTALSEMEIY